jgi:hypothetical protein
MNTIKQIVSKMNNGKKVIPQLKNLNKFELNLIESKQI